LVSDQPKEHLDMSGPDTAVADLRTHGPDLTGRARVGPAVLLVGALLVAAALSLHLRGGAEDVAFVQRIETVPEQWLIGHVLMAVGAVLLALGFPSVLRLARDRRRIAITVGVTLATVGAACTALGDFAHGSLAYVLIGHVDAQQSLDIQKDFFYEPLLAAVTILGNLLPLGMLVLGIGLLRAKTVPTTAAILVLVSLFAIQAGYMVPALPMPVMVLPFVVGLGWIASILFKGAR
jgi:hypothetical protein